MIRVVIKSVRPESFIGRTTPTVNRISAVILNLSINLSIINPLNDEITLVFETAMPVHSVLVPQTEVDVTSMTVR